MIELYPLKFKSILKQTLWGGERIATYKELNNLLPNVGESWEISGVKGSESIISNGCLAGKTLPEAIALYKEAMLGKKNYKRFVNEVPLLIKFIDAQQDLSIQVHPNDELSEQRHGKKGKTEMWYVIDAPSGSKLRSGFSASITPEEYKERVANHTITEVLKEYEIHAGDVFFLPAGRIHSIGAGAFITEIQQTSDVTYRIYDFNRKDKNGNTRELHTELAADAINYEVREDYRTHYTPCRDQVVELADCSYFTTNLLELTTAKEFSYTSIDSFRILICMKGRCTLKVKGIENTSLRQGECVFIPAAIKKLVIDGDQPVKLLETFIKG